MQGASPSAVSVCGLSADANPEATFFPDSEVEPWLVVNPANRDHMAAAWQQDRYLDGGCRGNVASVSFDGGVNWEHSSLPKLTPCTDGEWERVSDPWLTFAANGDLYSASLTFTIASGDDPFRAGVLVHKSVDGGLTWGDPMTVSETLGPFADDKEAITADPLDACSVYVVWVRIESGSGDTMFSRTTDCGETWSEPTVLYMGNPVASFAQIVVLPDGTVIAVFVEGGLTLSENEILVMRSSDGGATWPEEPVVAAIQSYSFPVAPDSDDTVRSGKFDIAVDRETGELHLAWEHFIDGVPPVGIAYASSADGGLTWSAPARIDRTPPAESFEREQAFLPSVEVSDDGTVGVTYYSFENDVPGDARSDPITVLRTTFRETRARTPMSGSSTAIRTSPTAMLRTSGAIRNGSQLHPSTTKPPRIATVGTSSGTTSVWLQPAATSLPCRQSRPTATRRTWCLCRFADGRGGVAWSERDGPVVSAVFG
ncbi:MAG: exo-alpha-sialidase [Deltaproteobacteria bacterium]|nr:exo-alpha-sialidase [Deltaproteobacteria bacterium]